MSNFVILVCANINGMYHKYLTDLTHRRTFLEARNYIQSMFKLEREKKQQVFTGFLLILQLFMHSNLREFFTPINHTRIELAAIM